MDDSLCYALTLVDHRDDAGQEYRWFAAVVDATRGPEGYVTSWDDYLVRFYEAAESFDSETVNWFVEKLAAEVSDPLEVLGRLRDEIGVEAAPAAAAQVRAERAASEDGNAGGEPVAEPTEYDAGAGDVNDLAWVTPSQEQILAGLEPAHGPWPDWLPAQLSAWWPEWQQSPPEQLAPWLDDWLPTLLPEGTDAGDPAAEANDGTPPLAGTAGAGGAADIDDGFVEGDLEALFADAGLDADEEVTPAQAVDALGDRLIADFRAAHPEESAEMSDEEIRELMVEILAEGAPAPA